MSLQINIWNAVTLDSYYRFVVNPVTIYSLNINFILKQEWPLGQNFFSSVDDPSTCQWAASGCTCERWSPCAWLPLRAAGMWRCSSSSTRRSAVSLPVAHPACRTGPIARPPAGQSPCNRGTHVSTHSPMLQTPLCHRSLCKGHITFRHADRDGDSTCGNPHFQMWLANARHINKCPNLAMMSTHTYQLSAPTSLPTSLPFSNWNPLVICCLRDWFSAVCPWLHSQASWKKTVQYPF